MTFWDFAKKMGWRRMAICGFLGLIAFKMISQAVETITGSHILANLIGWGFSCAVGFCLDWYWAEQDDGVNP